MGTRDQCPYKEIKCVIFNELIFLAHGIAIHYESVSLMGWENICLWEATPASVWDNVHFRQFLTNQGVSSLFETLFFCSHDIDLSSLSVAKPTPSPIVRVNPRYIPLETQTKVSGKYLYYYYYY